jgi:hypothetical protein
MSNTDHLQDENVCQNAHKEHENGDLVYFI